ncbi:MAG: hypothetical protein HZB26_07355 [Candidatus Hydrogenedentes bacterium]|nr:hypothetical protein [Candidatus Hydrogenedentota bacterium]
MSTEEPDLAATQDALVQNWSIVPVAPETEGFGREALLEALKQRVLYLIQHDFNRLMTAMYILDVAEERFKAAMATPGGLDNAAKAVAEVILEREMQKVITRQKYRNVYSIEDLSS